LLQPKRANAYRINLFHLVTCDDCGAEIEELLSERAAVSARNVTVNMIYVGHDESLWKQFVSNMRSRGIDGRQWRFLWDPDGSSDMYDLYDLEYVPHLYLLDGRNVIIAKDLSVSQMIYSIPEK